MSSAKDLLSETNFEHTVLRDKDQVIMVRFDNPIFIKLMKESGIFSDEAVEKAIADINRIIREEGLSYGVMTFVDSEDGTFCKVEGMDVAQRRELVKLLSEEKGKPVEMSDCSGGDSLGKTLYIVSHFVKPITTNYNLQASVGSDVVNGASVILNPFA